MWHIIVFLNSTGFKGQSAETKTSHFPLLTKSMINKETWYFVSQPAATMKYTPRAKIAVVRSYMRVSDLIENQM